jgi:DHA2 family multidrug resistance protein
LGSLEVVLEEGQRKDWFGSDLIVRLTFLAVVFLGIFFWRELTSPKAFINLRLLGRRNFGLGSIVNMSLGLGLYGSVYILPLYLAQIQGYNALQIGLVIGVSGLPQLLIIPFLPKLMQRFDSRYILAIGVFMFGLSCAMNGWMSHDTAFDQLLWSQLVRAAGQPFIITPLSSIITGDVPPGKDTGSASGLFNMMRNLGGSMGIALLSTILTQREQFHSNRLGESISLYSSLTRDRLDQLTQFFISQGADLVTAQNQAYAALNNTIRREAYVMAFNECFLFIALGFAVSLVAVCFLRKSSSTSAGAGGH